MKINRGTFFVILAIILIIAWTSLAGLWKIKGVSDIRFGIDIRGGVEAIFEPADYNGVPSKSELDSARAVIETRLDDKNILDREVTVDEKHGNILVRFPWVSGEKDFDPEAAITELGAMERLTFRDEAGKVLVEGKNVERSTSDTDDQTGLPIVSLEFNSEGSKQFAEATEANIGKGLYIYMDETLLSSPTVDEAIYGGNAMISGDFTTEETQALAAKINSGALPFSLETKSFSTISPTLASDALKVMVMAGILSLLCICGFMLVRYKLVGMVSCLALILQITVQLLAVSMTQITLTLPGIAGIILSIGMGVDANIIISERISDELRNGRSIGRAIEAGYRNAFKSVLDGNLTTLIVALLLIIFGSGSMLSFGYTLTIGIIMNFVAGVGATNLMLRSLTQNRRFYQKKFFRIAREPKTRKFFEKRRLSYTISVCIIIAGLLVSFIGGVSLDTQFKGGVVLKYQYENTLDAEKTEAIAADVLKVPATAQVSDDFSGDTRKLVITLAKNEGISPDQQSALTDELQKSYPDCGLKLSESFSVQPYIGERALTKALIAFALAALMIILYIWIRFKNISGLSAGVMALLALLHDAFVVFAVFVIAGFPIGDSFVAVTLTIIGYSINDTIVIYDRLRENSRLHRKLPIPELVNMSISQSLTRSVFTSMTTLASIIFMIVFALWNDISSIIYFAVPMAFGLISGCYSSVCIADPLWASWQQHCTKRR